MTPTTRQITAARALLGWTMDDLAREAGCGRSTVADWEREVRTPGFDIQAKIVGAMEAAGVRFIAHGVRIDVDARQAHALAQLEQGE